MDTLCPNLTGKKTNFCEVEQWYLLIHLIEFLQKQVLFTTVIIIIMSTCHETNVLQRESYIHHPFVYLTYPLSLPPSLRSLLERNCELPKSVAHIPRERKVRGTTSFVCACIPHPPPLSTSTSMTWKQTGINYSEYDSDGSPGGQEVIKEKERKKAKKEWKKVLSKLLTFIRFLRSNTRMWHKQIHFSFICLSFIFKCNF